MKNYIFLIDCDNFFVSCERLFRPDIRNKPVLVLSSNDGCVISRSQEVKSLGVKMGEPFFKIRELCEKNNVSLFSSNFELYRDVSARVMSVLRRFSNTVEVYSVDEAFLMLSFSVVGEGILFLKAKEIRETVFKEIGIPVSVGVSHTKTLAKVATHFAKPKFGNDGCFVLVDESVIIDSLQKVEIVDVWGIGRRLAPRLIKEGVHTAFDFYSKPYTWIQTQTSILGVRTSLELHGVRQYAVGEDTTLRKSLLHSQSFGHMLNKLFDIETMVAHHARKVAETLREESILAREVHVFLYTARKNGKRERFVGTEILTAFTNSTLVLVDIAIKIVQRIYKQEFSYSKAGVLVSIILPEGAQPTLTLFGDETNVHTSLMTALDTVQSKFGDVVYTCSEMKINTGRAKSNHLSPRRTTRWKETLTV